MQRQQLHRISDVIWELPVTYKPGMRVPARIVASDSLIDTMDLGVLDQISNVAMLPGIVNYAYCMPDGHLGYGFPIGGVAAMDIESGVISPGGIGFDINCGMRLIVTSLTLEDVQPVVQQLVNYLFTLIPSGVGGKGKIKISNSDFHDITLQGSKWCILHGYGWEEDLDRTEERGTFRGADVSKVSSRAIERGIHQLGTLGSGNHYLEIQVIKPEHIFDDKAAAAFGINKPNQIAVMFHCGSRGFGHQIATDYLQSFLRVMEPKYHIHLPDRQLACAPFMSDEGQSYFAAMKCAANMSFANRQLILFQIRNAFSEVFRKDPAELGMHQVYDIAHNTAKVEEHLIDGKKRKLIVHRKGSTRAFGPGSKELPYRYASIGQPVIIGGSMETGSYLLKGIDSSSTTLFSTAHGSGRVMSRKAAKHDHYGRELAKQMAERGIYVRTDSYSGLAEEGGFAYKNIDEIVETTDRAMISKPVAKLLPLGNIKG